MTKYYNNLKRSIKGLCANKRLHAQSNSFTRKVAHYEKAAVFYLACKIIALPRDIWGDFKEIY